jgi:hypothetical protein
MICPVTGGDCDDAMYDVMDVSSYVGEKDIAGD